MPGEANRTDVSLGSRDVGLFEVDALAAYNWRRMHGEQRPLRGEEKLMLALLTDALIQLQKYAFAESARGQQLFDEDLEWFLCASERWPCEFGYICQHFGLKRNYILQLIDRWHNKVLLGCLAKETRRRGRCFSGKKPSKRPVSASK